MRFMLACDFMARFFRKTGESPAALHWPGAARVNRDKTSKSYESACHLYVPFSGDALHLLFAKNSIAGSALLLRFRHFWRLKWSKNTRNSRFSRPACPDSLCAVAALQPFGAWPAQSIRIFALLMIAP